ncbi:hypothetical protein BJV78DRAFT_393598 [Lactifluus subvellereus]|nr:hypothetical protein BJV78DRAFT_393598 [Lactifluus subvellereus]
MAQSSHSPAVAAATPPRGQPPPPISSLVPLVISAGSWALSCTAALFKIVSLYLLSPILVVIPVIFYLLSPILISSQLLLNLFVLLPYRAAVYISQAVYPIYAFVGVACLSGAIIGMGARQIVNLVGWVLLGEKMQSASTQRSASPPRTRPQKKASTRGKRRVIVKTEE